MRISLLFLLFVCLTSYAFSTEIRCSNPEYAGKELNFFQHVDPVSGEKKPVFTLHFDKVGNAQTTLKNTQTIYAFSEFGVYRGLLFLEPNTTLELKLPPVREKSFADEKNPYFSPVSFWFITETQNQLNDKVSKYEQQINFLSDKYFNELYFQQSKTMFDSLQQQLKIACPAEVPQSFVHHKNLKIELLRADIFRLHPKDYSSVFNPIKPEFWLHPAFVTLFTKTFDEQLSFSAKAINGKVLFEDVAKNDIKSLLNFVEKKYQVSGKMAELVLLKLLHDAFYSNDFSKATIRKLVSNQLFSNNSNPIIKAAAKNTSAKFSFLQQGSVSEKICLNNLQEIIHCTDANSNKFKYIIFADVETVVCKEHLKYLSRIDELFNKHLEIFVILRDTDKKAITEFFETYKVPAVKLLDPESKYAETYKIRSYPQCFLLNEKHEVVFTNTKNPLDGFEQQFGPYLRNELFMRQRNQSR